MNMRNLRPHRGKYPNLHLILELIHLQLNRETGDRFWEAVSLGYLARVLTIRNKTEEAELALEIAMSIFEADRMTRSMGVAYALQADLELYRGSVRESDQGRGSGSRGHQVARPDRLAGFGSAAVDANGVAVGQKCRGDPPFSGRLGLRNRLAGRQQGQDE